MIYEWRTYSFAPGRALEYLDSFGREGLPLVTRHLPLLGYWLTDVGRLNVLHHLWAYASLDERSACRVALAADADWTAGFGPRAFPMIERQETAFLSLVGGSPALSDAVANRSRSHAAVASGSPRLATSRAILEAAGERPPALPGTETIGVWQVVAGDRPGGHLGLFHALAFDPVPTRPASWREIMLPTIFSPLQ